MIGDRLEGALSVHQTSRLMDQVIHRNLRVEYVGQSRSTMALAHRVRRKGLTR